MTSTRDFRNAHHETSKLSSGVVVHHWPTAVPTASVILQHGFGEYAQRYVSCYSSLIPRLNENSFNVWAIDLWGHGLSPGIRTITHVGKAVDDHLELRHRLANDSLPVLLLGHSLGGLITAGSVIKDSSHIIGVVLTGPALPAASPIFTRYLACMLASVVPSWPVPAKSPGINGISRLEEEVSKAQEDGLLYKGPISYLLGATALQTASTLWPSLSKWDVPVLVVHGTSDTYTDHKQSHAFVERIAAQDKEILLIEDGRHEALNDIGREEVLEKIMTWLKCHAQRRPLRGPE